MRIGGRWSSGNVRDRRGMGVGLAGGGIGVVVIALVAMLFGVDPGAVLQGGGAGAGQGAGPPAESDSAAAFASRVLGTTEGVWSGIFREEYGREYRAPTLVLFSGSVQSACGFARAATGPFYCPRDQQLYIDLSFYRDLAGRLGAAGDFAQAYVVAHEVGHHVQTLLGLPGRGRAGAAETGAGSASVRQELQADCFAGVWANRVGRLQEVTLEPGDIEEGLGAAAAVGDDRLQQESQGYVVPESFTHGTSAQRVAWFRRGYESGEPDRCDTFSGAV